MRRAICMGVALLAVSYPAAAQNVDLNSLVPAGGATASGRIIELVAILTVLSVAPGLLIMVTSFTRFIVALSFLRSGLGLQSAPANLVLISLALFMTFFVMAPTFDQAWQKGLKPLMDNQISQQDALAAVSEPFREFMLSQVREKDMALFEGLSKGRFEVTDRSKADLRLLIPAFMISELRRGFEIGFLIVLPFLVIDMIVATLTMSMGMMMLPPSVISLPVKILFFVLIDAREPDPVPASRKAARLKWIYPPRTLHEHSEHQRLGHAGQFELAIVDFPECRQRQHQRLQERRDRLLEPGRSALQRRRGV